jgi:hypothetical protein
VRMRIGGYCFLCSVFCSPYLVVKHPEVCPMYTLWHVLPVSLYIPLSSKFCVERWVLCFVLWSIVLVLLNAILVFVCLKR